MKTYELIYDETVVYKKIIEAKNKKEAEKILNEEVNDLSTWQIQDVDSQYSNIEEVA